MKLAPLSGLFVIAIQVHGLRFYNLNFNKIKYLKPDQWRQSCGLYGRQLPRCWAGGRGGVTGGRGRVAKYYNIVLCTGNMFESGDF